MKDGGSGRELTTESYYWRVTVALCLPPAPPTPLSMPAICLGIRKRETQSREWNCLSDTQAGVERVYLGTQLPEGPTSGPAPVEGMLVAELRDERDQCGQILMTNHTIMWREKGKGTPAVLESALGRWLHALMVRRLVDGGVRAMVEGVGDKKGF